MSKRWLNREQRWRAPADLFNPRQYAVDAFPGDTIPKRFIEQHHYSGSYPAALCRVGLFGPGPSLVGVAVFSSGGPGVVRKWVGEGVELGRLVLLDTVAYNAESWFVSRAFELLEAELQVRRVVSFADPVARPEVPKPAHWGTIYKALNGQFAGRAEARWRLVAPDGQLVERRMLTKLAAHDAPRPTKYGMTDRGWQYGLRWLAAQGATPHRSESMHQFIKRLESEWRRVYHPGNLAYLFGFDSDARSALRALHPTLPYIKAA
jgi:hypothetical protein